MPGIYQAGDYDLAGFAVGAADRDKLLPRDDIAAGDVVIGLASSGVHSNGFSLVRRIVAAAGLALGCAGAVRAVATARRSAAHADAALCAIVPRGDPRRPRAVKALAHITGGGFVDNIPRVLPHGLGGRHWISTACPCCRCSNGSPPPAAISEREMLRTFNCGIGMVAVLDAEAADAGVRGASPRMARPSCGSARSIAAAAAARVAFRGRLDLVVVSAWTRSASPS